MATQAVELIDRTDDLRHQGQARMVLGGVLQQAGRTTEAVDVVREAQTRFERKGVVVSAARARSFLERLTSPLGDGRH